MCILKYYVVVLGILFIIGNVKGENPYYPNPWSFYSLVNFPTSDSSYIAEGYLYGTSYREDEHGVGYYYQNYFVFDEKRVFHVNLNTEDYPIDCTAIPYPTLPWAPDMCDNATFIETTIIQDVECDLYKGEWNDLKYEMCHKPSQSSNISRNSDIPNGYMVYFLTTYKPPFFTIPTPISYTFYDFKSGIQANSLVTENDLIPPNVCGTSNFTRY